MMRLTILLAAGLLAGYLITADARAYQREYDACVRVRTATQSPDDPFYADPRFWCLP